MWLEAIRGILADLYLISRGIYSTAFYVGFIGLHLVVIGTAIAFVRQAQEEAVREQKVTAAMHLP